MAHIRSRKHAPTAQPLLKPSFVAPSLLALGALTSPLSAHAQQAGATETLPEVKVKSSAVSDTPAYKVEKTSSPKQTQPLLDTPQTITVIPKELLEERGATTLTEALRNTPGITLQLGENGTTSTGDTFQMRGASVQTSIFVDGIRDLGAVTRDMYNIDQVEVMKGAAGTIIGRGATSGYINLVTKLPSLEDATSGSATYNTADNKRLTADFNRKIGDTTAVRIDVMGQNGGVPGRDVVENNSWGIAPSVAWGLGTPTRVYVYAQHNVQDNVPDGGLPTNGLPGFYKAPSSTAPATNAAQAAAITGSAAVDRSNYYGSVNDYEHVTADMVSAKVEHDFAPGTTLRNITRYGTTSMDRIITGVNATSMSGVSVPNLNDPSTWTVPRTRQGVDQINEIITNQTNVTTSFNSAGFKHDLSGGLELSYERQKNNSFSSTGLVIPQANLYNPNANDVLPLPYKTGGSTDGNTVSISPYILDTIELTKQWLINGGLRLDHYKTQTDTVTATQNTTTGAVTALTPASYDKSGNLWSWNIGAVYKPVENGSVYVSAGNSQLPPGGSSFALVASSSSNANNVNLDPQETTNLELGTKWDLLNKKLGLTAALYRTEIKNEIALLDSVTNTYGAFGKRRVQGIELGAAGDLTPQWHVNAGLQTMDTKITSGTAGTGTNTNATGAAARWSPDLTATLWTTYDLPAGWQVGAGLSYVSEQKRVTDPTANVAANSVPSIPSYTTVDAMASYVVNKNLTLRLNVYNLFDKEYIATLNNSGSRYTPGAPRYASLTANFLF